MNNNYYLLDRMYNMPGKVRKHGRSLVRLEVKLTKAPNGESGH
jgi:hypothetical protein